MFYTGFFTLFLQNVLTTLVFFWQLCLIMMGFWVYFEKLGHYFYYASTACNLLSWHTPVGRWFCTQLLFSLMRSCCKLRPVNNSEEICRWFHYMLDFCFIFRMILKPSVLFKTFNYSTGMPQFYISNHQYLFRDY